MPAPLEIQGLEVSYGLRRAVKGVDLRLRRGGLTAIVGPSGCGKTSLLRAIAGFEVPTAGEIRLEGKAVASPAVWVGPEARRVGMVFQQGALFPHLTVGENVQYGLQGLQAEEQRRRAVAALERVGMEDRESCYPNELSGGEQQRVALARALAPEPRLVLLDEPFASLDEILRHRVREDVRSVLAAAKATALLVTHDQEEAMSLAETVVVMAAGRILQVGTPEEIYLHPASLEVARFFGDGQLFECRVEAGQAECCLGTAACSDFEGQGRLWIRPEDLSLQPEEKGDGLPGRLERRNFFGHDQVEEVVLDQGDRVRIRVLAPHALKLGARVRVALREKVYPVFPPETA